MRQCDFVIVYLLLSSLPSKEVHCGDIYLPFISGGPGGRKAGGWRLIALRCHHLQVGGVELPTSFDATWVQNK